MTFTMEMSEPEMIEKIHDLVVSDQYFTLHELFVATGVFRGSVHSIIHEKFRLKKICNKDSSAFDIQSWLV